MTPRAPGRPRAPVLSCALPLTFALGLSCICVLGACSGPNNPTTALHGDDIRGVMPPLEFTLTGPSGATMSAADVRGKTVLLYFGYTHCPDVCLCDAGCQARPGAEAPRARCRRRAGVVRIGRSRARFRAGSWELCLLLRSSGHGPHGYRRSTDRAYKAAIVSPTVEMHLMLAATMPSITAARCSSSTRMAVRACWRLRPRRAMKAMAEDLKAVIR